MCISPQLLCVCLEQTSTSVIHYFMSSFFFLFFLHCKEKQRFEWRGKNDIGLILLDLLMIWESDWLKETWDGVAGGQQMGWSQICREEGGKITCSVCVCVCVCTRMHASAQTDRISESGNMKTSLSHSPGTHWGLHIRSGHSRPSRGNRFPHYVIRNNCYLPHYTCIYFPLSQRLNE